MAWFRRDLASGLVVVAPVAIVLLVIQYLFRIIAGLPLVARLEPAILRVIVVIIVFLLLVISVGYAMRSAVGAFIADLITAAINRIPGLRVVYNASHLAVETILRGTTGGVRPVKVESWDGLRVTAFDTGNRTEDGRIICFFPTAPNITTGYVIEVEEEDLHRTGETVEVALLRILSAGFGDRSVAADYDVPMGATRRMRRVNDVQLPDTK